MIIWSKGGFKMSGLAVEYNNNMESKKLTAYHIYLVIVALLGWALASYDFNLLVLTMPNIAQDLHLSATFVGLLAFIIYAAEFIITMFVGYGMDKVGRRWMWQFSLIFAALFTGITFFVQNYVQLAIVRALASGFALSELSISITLVNEQLPANKRGLLYSIVQGGWPLGVFFASGVYLLLIQYGWRTVFLLGVIPIIFVIIARTWVKESDRFLHIQKVKKALVEGNNAEVERLLKIYPVEIEEANKVTWQQLFGEKGYVRNQVTKLTIIWLSYATAYVATNVYINYWLVNYMGWTDAAAGRLVLISSGIGYFFYILGGYLGEKVGRKWVMVYSAILATIFNLLFLFVHTQFVISIIYFIIYQATNGTWSGAGYAYIGESFPTRVRGTAIGFLGAMFSGGLLIGSALWTVLISAVSPTLTWILIAVVISLGAWVTIILPNIKPGTELEDISK